MRFTSFPILTTERLTLRQLSNDDSQDIFALRSDAQINKYLDRPASKTIDDAINFINSINENIKKNDSFYWAITLTTTKVFAGTICLFNISGEDAKCEIGYELLTNFQKQGIMKEAAEKIIDFVFNTLQIEKIEAFTHIENGGSTKLLEKLGFKKTAELDKENPDYCVFALINEE